MHPVPTVTIDHVPDPLPEALTILDVREQVEWDHGHVDGSVHIPLMEVPGRLADLPADGQLLVVCKVGGRSAQAVGYLVQQGLDAVNLDGGLVEWADAGRALVDNDGNPGVV